MSNLELILEKYLYILKAFCLILRAANKGVYKPYDRGLKLSEKLNPSQTATQELLIVLASTKLTAVFVDCAPSPSRPEPPPKCLSHCAAVPYLHRKPS